MPQQAIPADDGARELTLADPDDENLTHLAVGGSVYTILIPGTATAGRYALIEMRVPPASGPPPHRHDFEEMFHVLEGQVEVTLRGVTSIASASETVNVPALAPHFFANRTKAPVRLLCLVSPAGLEDYFAEFGDPVPSRNAPAPNLNDEQTAERVKKARALASNYGIEIL